MDALVSVIIPIYNTAPYLVKCLKSLIGQTLEDIELIFVDDCSSDNSLQKLKELLASCKNDNRKVHIIANQQNLGAAVCRQKGLEAAHGEYVIHCDSDDWIDADMLEQLYSKAKASDADIVGCSFYENANEKQTILIQSPGATTTECIKMMLTGQLHGSVWNKLIRRSLIIDHAISFPAGYNNKEDLYFTIQAFAHAKSFTWVDKPFYHYRVRESSLSRGHLDEVALSKKIRDSKHNVIGIEQFLKSVGLLPEIKKELNIVKARVKNDLFDLTTMSLRDFRSTFPEAKSSLDYFSFIPRKVKLAQQLLLLGS